MKGRRVKEGERVREVEISDKREKKRQKKKKTDEGGRFFAFVI